MSSITTLLYSFLLAIILWAGACRTALQRTRPFMDDAARYSDDVARGADDVAKLADDAATLTKAEKSHIRKALENHWNDIAGEIANRVSDDGFDMMAKTDFDPSDQYVIWASENMLTSHLVRIPRYLALAEDDEGKKTWKALCIPQEDPALIDAMLCINLSR